MFVPGVRGVVKRRESPATLLKTIEKVHEGELWIDRSATSLIFMEMARQKVADKTIVSNVIVFGAVRSETMAIVSAHRAKLFLFPTEKQEG